MGQLNIKDEALIAQARQLAELLGTSATGAVREAVADRLQREIAAREAEVQRRFEAIMEIAARTAPLFPPGGTSDHGDLYDEHGAPR
jgi:hypothetical protein